jgi:hypothetical protein
MFSHRLSEGIDIGDFGFGGGKDANKRRKLKDQEEVIQMKDKIIAFLQESSLFKEFSHAFGKEIEDSLGPK